LVSKTVDPVGPRYRGPRRVSQTASGVEEQTYAVRREQMIRMIEAQVHNLSSALGRDHIDPRVLGVMGKIPRHEFVPEDFQQASYEDRPLPIGFGQTISQPLIVALMTDVLNVDRGSGYQAAVAAELARQVYTITPTSRCGLVTVFWMGGRGPI